jgi:hypothetical protein
VGPVGLALVRQPPAAGQERPARTKFEYRALYEYQLVELAPRDAPTVEGALNKLGEDGWELVNVTLDLRPDRPGAPKIVAVGAPPARENRFYLKRPK